MNESNKLPLSAARRKFPSAAAALCLGAMLGAVPVAFAQSDGFKPVAELSAGIACEFPVLIEARGEGTFYKEFRDQNGNPVRIMSAGSKVDYRFTNTLTNAQYLINGRGAMSKTDLNSDGSSITTVQGHTVLIFFPTDDPPGPSTTEYVGKVVYTADADGYTVLQQASGLKSDVCAKLSSGG